MVGAVAGLDYVTGAPVYLTLYRSDMPPPQDAAPSAVNQSAPPAPPPLAKARKPGKNREKRP
jgi:hypothetical protein